MQAEVERGGFGNLEYLKLSVRAVGCSGSDAEALAGGRNDFAQKPVHIAFGAAPAELARIGVPAESYMQLRTFSRAQHIPDLLLAEQVVALFGGFIVGMHLEGHLPVDFQIADADGKLTPVVFVDRVADYSDDI